MDILKTTNTKIGKEEYAAMKEYLELNQKEEIGIILHKGSKYDQDTCMSILSYTTIKGTRLG
jgi:hypothetical protein